MDFLKKNFVKIIVVGLGLVALILPMFLIGGSVYDATNKYTDQVILSDLIFGSGQISQIYDSNYVEYIYFWGGYSTYGLISFCVLAVGVIVVALSAFIKVRNLNYVGFILIILSSLLMFGVLEGGGVYDGKWLDTPVYDAHFENLFGGYSFGAGVWVYFAISLLAGIIGIVLSLLIKEKEVVVYSKHALKKDKKK